MQTNPESAAVEAVAWATPGSLQFSAGKDTWFDVWTKARYGFTEPLYPQSALDALRGEVAMLRDALHIETHKVITCGVAASHPDASLSSRMEYAGKWDSPQAQEVRALRDKADAAERRVEELEAALQGVMYWDNGKSEWAEARAALRQEKPE